MMIDGWIVDDFEMIQKETESAKKEDQNNEMRSQRQDDLDRQS